MQEVETNSIPLSSIKGQIELSQTEPNIILDDMGLLHSIKPKPTKYPIIGNRPTGIIASDLFDIKQYCFYPYRSNFNLLYPITLGLFVSRDSSFYTMSHFTNDNTLYKWLYDVTVMPGVYDSSLYDLLILIDRRLTNYAKEKIFEWKEGNDTIDWYHIDLIDKDDEDNKLELTLMARRYSLIEGIENLLFYNIIKNAYENGNINLYNHSLYPKDGVTKSYLYNHPVAPMRNAAYIKDIILTEFLPANEENDTIYEFCSPSMIKYEGFHDLSKKNKLLFAAYNWYSDNRKIELSRIVHNPFYTLNTKFFVNWILCRLNIQKAAIAINDGRYINQMKKYSYIVMEMLGLEKPTTNPSKQIEQGHKILFSCADLQPSKYYKSNIPFMRYGVKNKETTEN